MKIIKSQRSYISNCIRLIKTSAYNPVIIIIIVVINNWFGILMLRLLVWACVGLWEVFMVMIFTLPDSFTG